MGPLLQDAGFGRLLPVRFGLWRPRSRSDVMVRQRADGVIPHLRLWQGSWCLWHFLPLTSAHFLSLR